MNCLDCKHCGAVFDGIMQCKRGNAVSINLFALGCERFEPSDLETLPSGGKQAKEPYKYELLPKKAIHSIVKNMTDGAEKYGIENYLDIPPIVNAGRAIAHLQLATMTEDERKQFSNEDVERHLINAATRALFALDCFYRGRAK